MIMDSAIGEQKIDDTADSQDYKNSESNIILRIFQNIISKWWLFLIIGLLAGISGFIYASKQKTIYESYLSFALDEGGSEGGMSGAFGLAAQFGISLGGAKQVFTGDNIIEIIKSRRIIEGVLLSEDTFGNKPYTFIEYYLEKIERKRGEIIPNSIHYLPSEDKNKFSKVKDSILFTINLRFAIKDISVVRPDKNLNIFIVKVSSPDEEFTKKFTDRLIRSTNIFYTDITSKKARETLEILEARVPEMKNKLNSSISNKASIQDANLNSVFSHSQIPVIKEQFNTEVYRTAYAEMFKNLEMARFQYLKSIPLMQIIDAANYPMKKITVSKLKTSVTFAFTAIIIIVLILGLKDTGFAIIRILKSN